MEIQTLLMATSFLFALVLVALLVSLAFASRSPSPSRHSGNKIKVSQDLKRIKEQIEE